MRYRFNISCSAAASFAALIGATAAGAEDAAVYTENQVSDFVDLLLEAADIENARVSGIRSAPDRAEAERIHYASEATLIQVIEDSELPLEVYDEMVARVQTDIRLSMQVYDELESRGEVVMLPEPESAVPVEETAPAFIAVEGEAGF